MEPSQVKSILDIAFPGAQIEVQSQGNHFAVTVVSSVFEGLNAVKRQQAVYAALNEQITSGAIHALQIKAVTPE